MWAAIWRWITIRLQIDDDPSISVYEHPWILIRPYLRAQAKLEVHIETTICLGRVLFISGVVNCLEPTNDNQLPLHSMVPTDPTLCQKCSIAGHDHLLEYLPEEGRTSGFSFPQLLVLLFSQFFVLFATDRHGFAFLPECSLACSTLWLCSPHKRTFGTIIDTGHTYLSASNTIK